MKRVRNRKFVLPALLAAVFLSLTASAEASWFSDRAEAARKKEEIPTSNLPRVEVAVVKRLTSVQQGISTTATLESLEEVIVKPKVTGRVESIVVTKGDRVEVGDTLVLLDSRDQKAEYNSLKAQVAVSKAELKSSDVTLADAKREYDRYSRLLKSGYATQQEYDTRSTTYQAAVASQAKAEAQVMQAEANLEAQGVTLSEYNLTAPIRGVVLEDYDITRGELVTTTTDVMRIGSMDKLRARVNIPEKDMSRLHVGMDAVLTFESMGSQQFYGQVVIVDPYVDTSTRTIRGEIHVDNQATGFKLRPGIFARVLLVETKEENPLVVPSEALRPDGTVIVVRDGKAVVQEVTKGATNGRVVSILDGLDVGEIVVVSGGQNVKDGDEVDFVITME